MSFLCQEAYTVTVLGRVLAAQNLVRGRPRGGHPCGCLEAYWVLVGRLGTPGRRRLFASVLLHASCSFVAQAFQATVAASGSITPLLEQDLRCQELLQKNKNE